MANTSLEHLVRDFVIEQVLSESETHKSMTLLGRFQGRDGQAILILSRRHFPLQESEVIITRAQLNAVFNNDIYYKFAAHLSPEHSVVTLDVIYPCTQKHISKHTAQQWQMVEETPELYRRVTLPHIESLQPGAIQWVYNILEHKKEADRILYEDSHPDTGFLLAPDLKWDQVQVEQLYCVAIVHRRDLRSLRDLDAGCIPLLENVLAAGCSAVESRYGVGRAFLRVYLHYAPSYYHLHVHFVHCQKDPVFGMLAGKAHLLQAVINNLRIDGEYYHKSTLVCSFGQQDPLFKKLQEATAAEGSGGSRQAAVTTEGAEKRQKTT